MVALAADELGKPGTVRADSKININRISEGMVDLLSLSQIVRARG